MAKWHWRATSAAAIGFVLWSIAGGDGARARGADRSRASARAAADRAQAGAPSGYASRPDRPVLAAPASSRAAGTEPAAGADGIDPEVTEPNGAELAAEQSNGGLIGEVSSADGERRIAWFVVALDPRTGDRHRAVTGAGGEFALSGLAPGDYEVWAMPVSRARLTALSQPDDVVTTTIVADDNRYLHLVGATGEALPPAIGPGTGTASGTLVDASGDPVVGARILAAPAGDGRWSFFSSMTTDDEGRFALHGLPPGEVRLLVVGLPGDPPPPVVVEVDGAPVTVHLPETSPAHEANP